MNDQPVKNNSCDDSTPNDEMKNDAATVLDAMNVSASFGIVNATRADLNTTYHIQLTPTAVRALINLLMKVGNFHSDIPHLTDLLDQTEALIEAYFDNQETLVDIRCPNDGQLVNKKCWLCGWARTT